MIQKKDDEIARLKSENEKQIQQKDQEIAQLKKTEEKRIATREKNKQMKKNARIQGCVGKRSHRKH